MGGVIPTGARSIFLGDLVDRGPDVVGVVNLVRRMVEAGVAFCVPGNHDVKLQRALGGANVQVSHGLADSLAQIEALPLEERAAWREGYTSFVESLVSHLVLDGGRLVVAHAGMKAEYQGRDLWPRAQLRALRRDDRRDRRVRPARARELG